MSQIEDQWTKTLNLDEMPSTIRAAAAQTRPLPPG
jgi:hypothetical protein